MLVLYAISWTNPFLQHKYMLVIQGPSLESVECPAGYPQENVRMTGYRNKCEMMVGLTKDDIQDRNEEVVRTRPEDYKIMNGVLHKL